MRRSLDRTHYQHILKAQKVVNLHLSLYSLTTHKVIQVSARTSVHRRPVYVSIHQQNRGSSL